MNASTRSRILDRFGISRGSSTPRTRLHAHSLARLPLIGALCALVAFAAFAPINAALNSETIATFGANCATPQTIFHLGDTVCAVAQGSLLGDPPPEGSPQRRFEWIAPNGFIFQLGPDIISDPQNNSIVIPATGIFARVGTWTVQTVDSSNNGYASTTFVVLDQNNAAADLWASISGPFQVSAGSSAPFNVFVTNKGPNDAQNVQLSVSVATNSTFQSETQLTGPAFSCVNPGGTASSTCTIANLPANTTARFIFVFQIDAATPGGGSVSSSASVTSSTAELFVADNSSTAFVTLPPQGQPTCDVTCPADITTSKTQGQCGAVVTFSSTGSGAGCGTVECNPASGSTFPIGTTNVICSGDAGGPCSFTVTVQDLQAPSITCPANVTVNESSPGFGLAVVNYPPPTLNDNCAAPIVACNPPSGSSFPVGTTAVLCQTNDGSGNTASCSFNVTVDGTGGGSCAINCPADVTQTATAGVCNAVVTYDSPTTSGSCGTVTCNPASGSTFAVGVTIVTCSGTGDSCSFAVTVLASGPPTITTCPANRTITTNPDCEAVVPNLLGDVVATGCGVTITQSPEAGSIVGAGVVTVTITAENVSGFVTCSSTVTIQDTTPPTIECPANLTSSNDADQCGAIVTYAAPSAADTCSTVTTTCSPASGAVFPVGTTTVTCTASDEAGNHASCSFTVRINDTQPPTVTCPSNISVGTDPNMITATVTYQPTVNDNCSGATVVCSPSSGSQFSLGTTAVNCTATDAANNQSACGFTVTVSDLQPPTITCPGSVTANSASGQCSAAVAYPNPTVTDNQPHPTFSCNPASGSTFTVGVTVVTCTATDAGGNQSSCSFSVTVRDLQAPTIACPANITVPNTQGQCSANVNVGAATAADNCSVASISGVRSDGLGLTAPYPVGTTLITWTARDVAGNQVSCTQTILVNDTQAPAITGQAATPSSLWPPNHKMVDVTINYTVTDNCTSSGAINCDLTVSSNEPPGSGDGHTSPDWTVIDAHHVKLKSERQGGGSGRVYTITITCKDSKNNTSTKTVTVTVPHNQ